MTRSKPLWSLSQPAHSVRVSCEGNLVADEAPAHSLRYDCPFGGLIEQVFGLSGNGKLARIELMRSAHSNCAGSQVALALLWICDRFAFAYSDPANRTAELPSGERPAKLGNRAVHVPFFGPVWSRKFAKWRPFSAFSREDAEWFSAVQTAWRRERDSNPRSGFGTLSLEVSVTCR